jgi:DtxR family Mn-dependent transcriptional regulator
MLTKVNKMKGEYDEFKKISCTNKEMISKSLEQYLKTMYILKKQNGDIRVTDIANKMNCSKPSVNKALNNLKDNDLVTYETYGKIELTEQGENLAKKILEAYDIVYLFLKDVLNLDSEEAEKEAENLKLAISDDTINKLAKYVHKVLDLNDLNCNYDINKEKCRICARRTKKA